MKAVLVDNFWNFDPEREKMMFAKEDIDFFVANVSNDEDYIEKCKDADAVLIGMRKTPAQVIEQLKSCKVMVRYGIGYDVIDVDACNKMEIAVCNIPDYCIEEVAAHTAALALDCLRQISYRNDMVHDGKWIGEAHGYSVKRLSGLTYGLCGFGNIARKTAEYMRGFGFKLIGYDPYIAEKVFKENNVQKVTLEELCQTADIISVHVPLNKDTFHLISKPRFDIMKKGMVIINTSRGGLVCQEDLLNAVDEGIVKAAGLDVLETEPLTNLNERILKYKNIVLTPHFAFNSQESFDELRKKVVESAISVLKGQMPYNVVNKKDLIK
jgi:D-3-phosphoglycerate dehydrogenase